MKRLIKLLLPPIFLKLWRMVKQKDAPESITYQGIYQSFQEVIDHFPQTTSYNNLESLELLKAGAQKKFQLLAEGNTPSLEWSNARLNLFPTFLSSLEKGKKITILDIGGGLGDSFVDLKYSCPQLSMEYYVHDLPDVMAMGAEFQQQYPGELNFIEDFSGLRPNIILFGSSLQYFENYREIINQICELNPEFILLTDHPMGEVPTFVCAQVNMKDRVIPRYVFEIKEIAELFSKSGFHQVLKSVNYYEFHNFHNYEGEYRHCQHYNLAFARS